MISPSHLARPLFAALLAAAAGSLVGGCGGGGFVDDASMRAYVETKPAKSAFTDTRPRDFPIHGIDVSKYQGDIDWSAVKAGGTAFAYIKATEGADHIDPKFVANWNGSRAAGVRHGAYHFVYWCRPPSEEMAWFKTNVPVEPDALPPVLDVEATPTSRTCKRHLERDQVLVEMRQMLQDMERHYGKRPIIYTTVDFYEAILHPSALEDYPIWIRSTKYSPNVRYGSRKWHFWQYQSDGRVPGIRGNVDRNAFSGDAKQWLAFVDGKTANPSAVVVPTSTVASLPPSTSVIETASIPPMAPISNAPVPGGTANATTAIAAASAPNETLEPMDDQ